MSQVDEFIRFQLAQAGDPYILGSERLPIINDGRRSWDCSELSENASKFAGVNPPLPDGAQNQYSWCKKYGTLIPLEEGYRTRGALLFKINFFGGDHVVTSLGDNQRSVESKGRKYGTGVFGNIRGRNFNFAAKVPFMKGYGLPEAPVTLDWAAIRRMSAADLRQHMGKIPNVWHDWWAQNRPVSDFYVATMQKALNLTKGYDCRVDGFWDDRTTLFLIAYQNDLNSFFGAGTSKDFPGTCLETTRFWLCTQLDQIAQGKA